MGLVAGLGVFLPAVLALGLLYYGGANAIHEEIRGNLQRVAKAASLLVDPQLHKTFTDPKQESTPEYEKAVAPLRAFVDSDKDFKYVYTFIEDKGQIKFVLDPTPEGDSDQDGVDDKSHIMQVYDEADLEYMQQAAREHVTTSEFELSDDQWGTFISGYAPIFDQEGNYVACIGVDISADRYVGRLAGLKKSAMASTLLAFIISGFVGVAAAFFQSKRHAWMVEQEASHNALEDLAVSLDGVNTQLRLSNRRFENLFNNIPVACFTFDENGIIYEWNRECERLIGLSAHDVIQKSVFDAVLSEENHNLFDEIVQKVFERTPVQGREWSDVGKDGQAFTVILNCFPLYGPDGLVSGGIVACSDITIRKEMQEQIQSQMLEIQRANNELQSSRRDLTGMNDALTEANERLKRLATIDALTGILNRRAIFEVLEKCVSSADRTSRELSILMVDIDHFKQLNDEHGHIKGDIVLKSVASILKQASRAQDEVGRFGGEEFLLVLPDSDPEDAITVAERIRRQVQESECDGLHVSVSVGIATYRTGFATIEQFVDAADKALYESKRRGRNRVIHYRDIKDGAA